MRGGGYFLFIPQNERQKIRYNFFMKRFFLIFLSIFVLATCSKPGDETVRRATEAMNRGDFELSEKLFLQAKDEESNYSPELIYSFLANISMAQGETEKACEWLEKSVQTKPDYRLLVTLAANYNALGKTELAEAALFKAIALDEKKGEAFAQLGAIRLGQKRFEEAVELLQKSIVASPRLAVAHANLAIAYAKLEQFSQSEEEFSKAEELKCENLDEFRARAISEE